MTTDGVNNINKIKEKQGSNLESGEHFIAFFDR